MTQLRDPQASESKTTDDGAEALHHLYRMSRTAGLGSGDYVAINNTAIVTLILGLASVAALLYPLMLIVPVAAVVCGVLAFSQIRSSNGTQTGKAFAGLGILAALATGGGAAWKIGSNYYQDRQDEKAIDLVIKKVSDLIVAKQYSQAYQSFFSETFKSEFTEVKFSGTWEAMSRQAGAVNYIDWGKRAEFEVIRGTGTKRAYVASIIKFGKFEPARQGIALIKRDGDWIIDDFQQIFARQKPGGGKAEEPDGKTPLGPGMFGAPPDVTGVGSPG